MALNTNYGVPPSEYSSPYSSTPTGIRAQRPRFGYSGPLKYPRSQNTSISDTHSFSDSMINNYGTSTSRFDTTFNSANRNSYDDSYNTSGSIYYSANNTFSHGQSYGEASMMHSDFSLRENGGLSRDNSMVYEGQYKRGGYSGSYSSNRAFPRSATTNSDYSGIGAHPRSDIPTAGFLSKGVSQFDAPKYNYNTTFDTNNATDFKGNFQKKANFGDTKAKLFFARKQNRPQKMFGIKQQSPWRCDLCNIDFTSQIPHDMHFRGAKHAKKIKTDLALKNVMKVEEAAKAVKSEDKKTFFCELCNVKANSSLQLQTHLEGSKHKAKLEALLHSKEASSPPESEEGSKEKKPETEEGTSASIVGKTNGSLVRPLPSDFGEPQPSKLVKYACEVCNVSVNSQIQLQQHLTSKKHQNKVEGKPITKGKKVRTDNEGSTPVTDKTEEPITTMEQTSNETSTKVVGVKTLASSFVQGETLQ